MFYGVFLYLFVRQKRESKTGSPRAKAREGAEVGSSALSRFRAKRDFVYLRTCELVNKKYSCGEEIYLVTGDRFPLLFKTESNHLHYKGPTRVGPL